MRELGRTAVALQLDVADIASLGAFVGNVREALQQTWSRDRFDFLINNGGMQITGAFADVSERDLDELIGVHFKGVFFLTQKLLPLLADGGAIGNISTGLTRFTSPHRVAYGSVKGAVEVLTRYLAEEPDRLS
ncbi:MAG: SDR family oxidoreductase [Gemmatimonadota bacterium]|nr:SDR family oxidoreductase [Gemmatimonadota bacterium]